MTLVNARAAIETAIQDAVADSDPTVTVVFDNTPFTTPGKNKKYVMVNINFTQATAHLKEQHKPIIKVQSDVV